jgi:hypothetical protein
MRRFILGWKQAGLERRLGARIVNYADDLVICCRGNGAETALESMRQMMTRLKLTINEEKTRTCRIPDDKFDFLGYTFGLCYWQKTGRAYIAPRPSKKSVKRMIEAVHVETGRNTTWLDAEELVTRLNRKLGGWANYFCYGPLKSSYRIIDWYTTNRLRRWLCKKHKQSGKGNERYPDEYLYKHLGLIRLPMLPKTFRGRRHDVLSESRMR